DCHSEKMHLVEKFTRQCAVINYDVTLEDPEVLAEPLVFPTRVIRLQGGAGASIIAERGNCETNFDHVRRDARRSGGAGGTAGVPDAGHPAPGRCGREHHRGTWQLRDEL